MGFGGGLSVLPLPTPYADEPLPGETSAERVQQMLNSAEIQRLFWGRLFMWWPMRFWRHGYGFMVALVAMMGVVLPEYSPRSTLFVFTTWSLLLAIAITPAISAAEHAMLEASLHVGYAQKRGRNLLAQPGSDRIYDSLKDVRRNNLIHVLLGLATLILLTFSTLTPTSSIAWNLSLMLTMVAGFAMAFHIQFTAEALNHLEDEEPFLTLHAPTHHPTQIHNTLSEVVATHLDPLLRMRWDTWRRRLAESLRTESSEEESLERLLYVVHLSQQGLIPRNHLRSEVSELYEDQIIEWMDGDDAPISIELLHRLVAHAKSWQPAFFHLVDRLQMDILDNGASVVNKGWRMDAECEYISRDGQGGLFIFLHNQTNQEKKAKIDVYLPGGAPDSYMFSVDVPFCPSPTTPLPLIDTSGGEDTIMRMAQYLDKTVVLWLKLSWSANERGLRQVTVSLKNEKGETEQSQILHTKVQKRIGAGDRRRRIRLRRAKSLVSMTEHSRHA